jgi:hypothetical protein
VRHFDQDIGKPFFKACLDQPIAQAHNGIRRRAHPSNRHCHLPDTPDAPRNCAAQA